MRFAYTELQEHFAAAVRGLLDDVCDPSAVRACWTNETGHDPTRWARLVDLGVAGLTVPESFGGRGGDAIDLVPVLVETGRAALPEPVVEHVAVVAPLLADVVAADGPGAALAAEWLPRLADGRSLATVQGESAPHVPAAGYADVVVLVRGDELHAVGRSQLTLTPQRSVDGARRLMTVDWRAGEATRLTGGPGGFPLLNRAFDRGALGTAAQLVGLGDRMVAMTVAHVTERRQFGVPVGSFQAVKHQLADAATRLEMARPLVSKAAWSSAHDLPERSRDVSAAKSSAAEAAERAGRVALQCHGAVGFTADHDLHLFLKRTWVLARSWGTPGWHRRRVAQAVLGPVPERAERPEPRPLGETLG